MRKLLGTVRGEISKIIKNYHNYEGLLPIEGDHLREIGDLSIRGGAIIRVQEQRKILFILCQYLDRMTSTKNNPQNAKMR